MYEPLQKIVSRVLITAIWPCIRLCSGCTASIIQASANLLLQAFCYGLVMLTCKSSSTVLWVFVAITLSAPRPIASCWFPLRAPLQCSIAAIAHLLSLVGQFGMDSLQFLLSSRDSSNPFYNSLSTSFSARVELGWDRL